MNKKNIIKSFLAGMLIMAASTLSGNTPDSVALSPQAYVPGSMFSVSADRNTAAVSTIGNDALYKNPAVNVSNSLAGHLPGLTLIQGSGQPNNDDALWLIRGIGSHGFGGYNTCKIFVDGFEVNSNYFTSMSPSEIESVSILKDGAALTLYGDRGANGVILIETKRGKAGPATVTTNIRTGVQIPTIVNKPLGSFDYAYNYNIAVSNDLGYWSPYYDNAQMAAYRDGSGVDVDWYDEVMRKNGLYVDGDINFNGGNDFARYNVVLGYLNQQGLLNVANTDKTSNATFSRYNVRANLDFNISKIFEARVDIGGKLYDHRRPLDNDNMLPIGGIDNLMYLLATYPNNIYNIYDDAEQTHFSGTSLYRYNPVGQLKQRGYRREHNRILQANFTLKENLDFITPGLYLTQSFSVNTYTASSQDKKANYARYSNGATTTTDKDETIVAGGWGSDGMQDWKQGVLNAGYDRSWGKHAVTASAGAVISAYKGDGYFAFKYNYLNYRGRVNYSYDNRYIVEAGFSAFGNDAYAPEHRWSSYPAISAAWLLSNESFLKGSDVVNHLKLRASFGMSGSADSESSSLLQLFTGSNGRFLYKEYYSTLNPYGSFYTGEKGADWQTTLVPMFTPNKDARSETSYKYNIGLDARLFGNKVSIMADFFLDKRKNILTYDYSHLYYLGWNSAMTNIGEMTNKGFEVMISYGDRSGDWAYSVMGMVSFNRNRMDEYGEVPKKYDYNMSTGNPYGTYLGLEADGFYGVDDFDSNGQLKPGLAVPAFGDVKPGDIKYRDLDDSGVIDDDDITRIGKPRYHEWSYSFGGNLAYKGFDLDLLLQGFAGGSVNLLAYPEIMIPFDGNTNTAYRIADQSWAYYPEQGIDTRDNAKYPRLTTEDNQNNYRTSSFWIKSNNYLKVRHIELGYTFGIAGTGGMRVYLNAANPFTFSKLMKEYDMDPERLGYGYPALRTFSLGVTLNF